MNFVETLLYLREKHYQEEYLICVAPVLKDMEQVLKMEKVNE